MRLLAALLLATLASRVVARAEEAPRVLVSRPLAEEKGLRVGDRITLSADPRGSASVTAEIVGVYEPVPDPLRISQRRLEVRLHLDDLLALTGDADDPQRLETVDTIHVKLHDPSRAHAFETEVTTRAPQIVVGSAAGDAGVFVVLERFHFAISFVAVLGSCAFLLALMVMRAEERRETAAILRVLGFSRRKLLQVVLAEGLMTAAAGAAFGVAFAWATAPIANAFFRARYDTALTFVRITPEIATFSVALAVPLGVLAGLVASWGLVRRPPVEGIGR